MSPKNDEIYLPVKDTMFPEVRKFIHKFANLQNANFSVACFAHFSVVIRN